MSYGVAMASSDSSRMSAKEQVVAGVIILEDNARFLTPADKARFLQALLDVTGHSVTDVIDILHHYDDSPEQWLQLLDRILQQMEDE